jgi:pentatricopeptide repeat protein
MSAWKRLASKGNRNAPERAGDLLERMEKWSDEGKLNTKPDNVAYFTVLTSWAISKEDGAAEKADAILEKVLKFYMAGDLSMKPSPKSFRVVIDAYVKKSLPQGLKRSEALLARMEQLHGKIDNEHNDLADSYKSLLFGYCKFGGNPTKAESFLRAMIENGMKPDSFCFDKILEAYTQSDDPNALPRSCGIFELMEQCRVSGDLKPNERVYTSFIRALTKGNVKNLAKKSRIVLDRMQDLYHAGNKGIEPTVFTYNAVLHACAACSDLESVEERTQAFEVALKTFNELRKIPKEHCDHVTFGNLMRCAPLMQDETKQIALLTATFRQCCQEGWVNSYIVRDLQNSAPESLWRDLLLTPSGIVDMDDFPMEWSKSLQRRK